MSSIHAPNTLQSISFDDSFAYEKICFVIGHLLARTLLFMTPVRDGYYQREIRGNGYIIFRNSSSKLHCPPTKELNGGHQPLKYQGHRIVSHDRSLRYDVAGVKYRYLERLGEKVFSLMRQIQITTTDIIIVSNFYCAAFSAPNRKPICLLTPNLIMQYSKFQRSAWTTGFERASPP